MTHTGWFHRSGPDHRFGQVEWVPAEGNGDHSRPPEDNDQPKGRRAVTDPSASPRSYPVGEVKGRCPAGLEDFVGVASFTVISGDLAERVFGVGERTATAVRFRQQDLGGNGREIRTWLIDGTPTGFIAVVEPNPAR